MTDLWQVVLTAIGASGIFSMIITSIVKRQMEKQYDTQDRRESLRDDNQLLMMARIDCLADMTHLMAKKLHDAGVINGDLEELDNKYEEITEKYDNNMKKLAQEVLSK